MDKPNATYPLNAGAILSPSPTIIPDTSIRSGSFNQLINNRGIRFIHKKALKCPNVKSADGRGHDPMCTLCDNSGYIYFNDKEIFGTFQSNSLEKLMEIQGVWEEGTAVVSFPTEYADGTQADFVYHDKLIIPDFQVRVYELREFEFNENLTERLRYPIIDIVTAISAKDSEITEYKKDEHFTIENGKIKWISGMEPIYDEITEKGAVISYSYLTNPEYNVVRHMHELRATQELINGQKVAVRLPMQLLIKRDMFQNSPEVIGS